MTSKDSHSQEYEVTDHDQIVPVASQGLLISQILDRLAAVEEENRQLRQEVEALRRDHDDHRETVGREIASDRRRISAPAGPGNITERNGIAVASRPSPPCKLQEHAAFHFVAFGVSRYLSIEPTDSGTGPMGDKIPRILINRWTPHRPPPPPRSPPPPSTSG